MRRSIGRTVFGAGAALVTAGAIALASGCAGGGSAPAAAASAVNAKAVDFSGAWQLDRKASDRPMGGGFRGGMRGPGGGEMGGGMDGGRRGGEMGGPPPGGPQGERDGGRERGRNLRLGAFLRIEQSATYVNVADSSGVTTREIVLGDAPKGVSVTGEPIATGRWKGAKLEVVATGPGGRMRVETWELSDAGKTLTITTRMEARDDRPAMENKRVYRKTAA